MSTSFNTTNNLGVKTFEGTSYPSDINSFATIVEGLYTAKVGYHKQTSPDDKRYLALRLQGKIPVKNFFNPNTSYKKSGKEVIIEFAAGVNIHKAGRGNFTGGTVSTACITCDRDRWGEFIDFFDKTSLREAARRKLEAEGKMIKYLIGRNEPEIIPATRPFVKDRKAQKKSKWEYIWQRSRLPNPTIGVGVFRWTPQVFETKNLFKPNFELKLKDKFEFPSPINFKLKEK